MTAMNAILENPAILGLVALAAMAVGGIAYAVLFTSIENDKKATRRLKTVKRAETDGNVKAAKRDRAAEAVKRRKSVADSLEKLDEKNKDRNRAVLNPPLEGRIMQAGMSMTMPQFYVVSVVCGLVMGVLPLLFMAPLYLVPMAMLIGGLGLPRFWIARKRKKRVAAFLKEFPNALDIIVRAIKSGLPLNDGIRLIAHEAKEPVRTEFQRIVENQQMGMATSDAIGRMYERVPTSEANFFAIVVAIQSQAGGNLSEALGNLSNVLRGRKQMREKVQALSMEAKASGVIIAALPFVVAIIVSIMNPEFLMPLIERDTGHLLLAISGTLYISGIGLMKKMINFEV